MSYKNDGHHSFQVPTTAVQMVISSGWMRAAWSIMIGRKENHDGMWIVPC